MRAPVKKPNKSATARKAISTNSSLNALSFTSYDYFVTRRFALLAAWLTTRPDFECFVQDRYGSAAAAAFFDVAKENDDYMFAFAYGSSVYNEFKVSDDRVVVLKQVTTMRLQGVGGYHHLFRFFSLAYLSRSDFVPTLPIFASFGGKTILVYYWLIVFFNREIKCQEGMVTNSTP